MCGVNELRQGGGPPDPDHFPGASNNASSSAFSAPKATRSSTMSTMDGEWAELPASQHRLRVAPAARKMPARSVTGMASTGRSHWTHTFSAHRSSKQPRLVALTDAHQEGHLSRLGVRRILSECDAEWREADSQNAQDWSSPHLRQPPGSCRVQRLRICGQAVPGPHHFLGGRSFRAERVTRSTTSAQDDAKVAHGGQNFSPPGSPNR